jgi:hypothetical protein
VVEEHRALVVEWGDEVDGVDDAERGVGDELSRLDRPRCLEEAGDGPVHRERREGGVGIAHRRTQHPHLLARDLVRRPVLRVVRLLVASVVAGRRPARSEGVHVAEQVVAVLHPHTRNRVRRPRQVGAGELLEHVTVVYERGAEVRRHEVD